MARADKWRRVADKFRALPDAFGLREHTVQLEVSQYSGELPGDGDKYSRYTPITVGNGSPPKVRFPSQKEVALGLFASGSVVIGPFTPDFGSGGFSRPNIDGSLLDTYVGMKILVTGPQCPNGMHYRVNNSNVDRALRIVLTCEPAGE
jgi:hypothetical protein